MRSRREGRYNTAKEAWHLVRAVLALDKTADGETDITEFDVLIFCLKYFHIVGLWRFIVLSQQLSGAAMVRRWTAYIHPRLVWGQVRGSCSRRRWEVWRTGQAGVLRKKLN